jgi:hypothetical protein
MARSLNFLGAGGLMLCVMLAGCGIMKTSRTQKLDNALATQEQADAAYRANDMQHAAALYLQLTKMIPEEADYWYMLGNAYVRTEQPDQAVQAYQQAIARDPNHSRAWHNLGIVRMRQAMAAFVSSASTAKPGDPLREVSTQLADELGRIGQGDVNTGKPQTRTAGTRALPVSTSRSTDRMITRGKAAPAANPAVKSWSNDPSAPRRKPGTSAGTDQP